MSSSNAPAGVTAVITERRASAPPQVQHAREEAVRSLDGLGMIDASQGQVPGDVLVGYDITIGGVTIPVPALGWEVVSGQSGPTITLSFEVDAVTVGGATTHQPVMVKPARPTRVWQAPTLDPRAGIPGWKPEEPADV